MSHKISPPLKISASRIKTFQTCSWKYYANYVLRLPDVPNIGAQQGTCCHTIFECLLKPRHKRIFDAVISAGTSLASPSIKRYIQRFVSKNGLPDVSVGKIDEMVMVGLNQDFFCEGGEMQAPEYQFTLESKAPRYKIGGFIDKPCVYKSAKGNFIRIIDFKSSKKKFAGEELSINVQAMMYSLAARTEWPDMVPIVDFIFLQFPDEPIQRLKFKPAELQGFEYLLEGITKKMENFTLKDAKDNLAAKQPIPGNGGGFKGPLVCGWAGRGPVTSPDQKKKNGDPMYFCSYKFPFDYWKLIDEDGAIITTSRNKKELKPDNSKGESIIPAEYAGCPAFFKR